MSVIPNDPIILLSFLNTKLRDVYPNLDVLCEDLSLEKEALIQKIAAINYVYDSERNQFI